ncbi:Holliday junction branch migration protein RuvA [Clostridium perfringens]|mgnify:FL=1|uniref:Holliday junction branch migration complex subunit RuvA n=1 Tax=Clostridium perfringens TaxID=1502 RepID=A0AAW9JZ13_CLOPF|nr:Holliday junction branch migration protein RuvA [Clostridium perfringens]EGT3612092.1 Holliday junction branch migration protein RuvA [Clostridium perfringens]EHK2305751.1 Holliday junction branch migration protein RuvA [Clostridium perfringens]EHK2348920.1 Holliday junction branch migration protein RuvA [Clostridium perfringens]EHK2356208.1 Holliday junction branch migration protein RuvA [Clostridium perfringens]EHK2405372.1 Holliday junction branch migration protein RuvA [Clostridium perf
MYEYIRGQFQGISKDYVVIELNNIGYKIFTSGNTMSNMPKVGDEVLLYLEQIVREDFIGLYGFTTREELEMFKLLLSINGVGAKAALSLLSISTVNNLKYAIMMGDEKHITRAPGIGKKTAQRIILELKDKLKPDELTSEEGELIEGINDNSDYSFNINETLSALMALGYTEKEAQKALEKVDKTLSIENMIKESLKLLMR